MSAKRLSPLWLQVSHTMHNMRILNVRFSMPRTGWDAKTWLRILARLGVLGAVL